MSKVGPTRRICCTFRRYYFRTISTDLPSLGPQLRAITSSSSRQLNTVVVVTGSQLCHFDAPVVTVSTVSWSIYWPHAPNIRVWNPRSITDLPSHCPELSRPDLTQGVAEGHPNFCVQVRDTIHVRSTTFWRRHWRSYQRRFFIELPGRSET